MLSASTVVPPSTTRGAAAKRQRLVSRRVDGARRRRKSPARLVLRGLGACGLAITEIAFLHGARSSPAGLNSATSFSLVLATVRLARCPAHDLCRSFSAQGMQLAFISKVGEKARER